MSRQASFDPEVDRAVRSIIKTVRTQGDDALRAYAQQFDNAPSITLKVPPAVLREAYEQFPNNLKDIISEAAANIRQFHERQKQDSWFMDDGNGVVLGQRVVAIEKAGVYVPGGKAFYPSSLLMN
ncbi:MAG: histidinol dehydrogenase, partial [Bacteroidota bacterium]